MSVHLSDQKTSLNFILLFFLLAISSQARSADPTRLAEQGNYDLAAAQIKADKNHPLHRFFMAIKEQKLYLQPTWTALLHYKSLKPGRYRSRVDSPWFFMSAEGKTNPQSELEATLASFLSSEAKPPMRLSSYCRFVARRDWLSRQFEDLDILLPKQQCEEFKQYRKFLKADHLTLVFPAAHPNSPASAFGHTLLRIDQKNQNPNTRMLNMSVNFAAEVPEATNPISYAVLGLTGGFVGKYTVLPYHLKLREYGQIDNRDIWEFELDFDQEQLALILKHSYEMLIAHFDYYFFHENCAYQLLSLLDVASPENRFTDRFSIRTIPLDTIKLLGDRGLIRKARYIPSTVKTIDARVASYDPQDRQIIAALRSASADKILTALDDFVPEKKSETLEILGDNLRYRRLSRDSTSTSMSEDERKLLMMRSKLGASETEPPSIPSPDQPNFGHGTQRAEIGFEDTDGLDNIVLSYRPAYHSLSDPSRGYGSNTAIDFLNLAIATNTKEQSVFLRKFTLLDIRSIEPRTAMFKPFSWRTSIDWEKYSASDHMAFDFSGGAGISYRHKASNILGFGFANLGVRYDDDMDKASSLITGVSIGGIFPMTTSLKFIAEAATNYDPVNQEGEIRSTSTLSFAPTQATTLKIKHEFRDGLSFDDQQLLKASISIFF